MESVDWRKSYNMAAICCPGIVHVKKPALIRLRHCVEGEGGGERGRGGEGGIKETKAIVVQFVHSMKKI